MRSPSTANEDHPGPIGRRHNLDRRRADQSVAIRTPRTTLSRAGPRKPGHSERVATGAVAVPRGATGARAAGAAGLLAAGAARRAGPQVRRVPLLARWRGGAAATGARRGRRRREWHRAPGLGEQALLGRRRPAPVQVRLPSPLMPPVRTSAISPQASRTAAAMTRGAVAAEHSGAAATAQATSATAQHANAEDTACPHIPLETDGCTTSQRSPNAPGIGREDSDALGPRRAAEEQPPDHDDDGADAPPSTPMTGTGAPGKQRRRDRSSTTGAPPGAGDEPTPGHSRRRERLSRRLDHRGHGWIAVPLSRRLFGPQRLQHVHARGPRRRQSATRATAAPSSTRGRAQDRHRARQPQRRRRSWPRRSRKRVAASAPPATMPIADDHARPRQARRSSR